ncbi:MAG TPA: Ig-like domain-containing protein [Solirubrobacteraceae bacterium]|jgi:hypothetical protein
MHRLALPVLVAALLLLPAAAASADQCDSQYLHSGAAAFGFDGATAYLFEPNIGVHANATFDLAADVYFRTAGDPGYAEYTNPDPAGCTREDDGREVVFPSDSTTVTDLTVTRKAYADPDGGWVRVFDSFQNTGAAAITIDLAYYSDHYSDADAAVGATSSGDATGGADDDWATQIDTNGTAGDFDSGAGWTNWQSDLGGTPDRADAVTPTNPAGAAGADADRLSVFFNGVTIQPGATVSYIVLTGLAETAEGARDGAAANGGGPPGLTTTLSADEIARLRNWPAEGDADHDGKLNSADNCATLANADQLDTDGDKQGDVCDLDDDADGNTDELEAAIGTDPRKADTDGDGVGDKPDQCPVTAGDPPNGCRTEDRPPAVRFATPADGARISPTRAAELTATAADDRGVARVLFVDDGNVVCTDTTAPYSCDYSPTGNDVGSNTLAAVAIDTTEQTATAFKAVRVSRFAPRSVTARTTPSRDRSAPFRFRTTGRVARPAAVTAAQGCRGKVSIQVKSRGNTISTRRVKLSRSCTYRSRVTFRVPQRLFGSRLKVTARFLGNSVLTAKAARSRSVRVG